MATTLFDKLWDMHRVKTLPGGADLIAIDRTFLHERTGSVALTSLAQSGRHVKRPERVFVTMDHIVSNDPSRGENSARTPGGDVFIRETRKAAKNAGINLIDVLSEDQGIVHVVAPELGIAFPGLTMVCPDSHTCSLGALGALAWGIGSTDAEHAMATGTLRVKKPPQMKVQIDGRLPDGVTAKDIALHLISKYGAAGGKRSAIEFCGSTVEAISIEERLTLCNLAVEFAAFTAIIAPDEITFDYVKGRRHAPRADQWDQAKAHWQSLKSDQDAAFDHEIVIAAKDIKPTVSWGNSPEQAAPIDQIVPQPEHTHSPDASKKAFDYMGLMPGEALKSLAIGGAFIGSCTNGRLSDLRTAATVLMGRKVAPEIKAICVPGSMSVRRAAEAEGLDKIFKSAGFEWGAPGCAFCFYAGGETFAPKTRVISSTNRNFESRQGPGVRTHLASPAIVAASAVMGRIAEPSDLPLLKEAKNVA